MAARIEKERTAAGAPEAEGIDKDEVNRALRQQFTRDLLFGGADTEKLLARFQEIAGQEFPAKVLFEINPASLA